MWWLLIGLSIALVLGFFEWRSWKKPVPGRLQDHWRVNNGRDSGRAVTGGSDFDSRHD